MKRWNANTNTYTEDKDVDAFLHEIIKVCKKHNMSIGHEDSQGAFEIYRYDKKLSEWLKSAMIRRDT